MKYNHLLDELLVQPRNFKSYTRSLFNYFIFTKADKEYQTGNSYNRKTIKKQLRKNTNLNNLSDFIYIDLQRASTTKIEIQRWRVTRYFELNDDGQPVERFRNNLYNLKILRNDKVERYKIVGDQVLRGTNSFGMNTPWMTVYTLPQNINIVHRNSELKYLVALHYLDLDNLETAYKYRSKLEVLLNYGATAMFYEVLNNRVDMRTLTSNFIKKNRADIKKYNLNFSVFQDYLKIKEVQKIDSRHVELLDKRILSYESYKDIVAYENAKEIKKRRLFKYLTKQQRSLTYYIDYLDTLELIGEEITTWQQQYPKDLTVAHDIAVETSNAMKYEAENESYHKIVNKLEKLEYEDDNFKLVVPKEIEEIVLEGQELEHCIKSYIPRVLEKETVVLFVRLKDKESDPFYTVEYKNGRVNQFYGYGNIGRNNERGKLSDSYRADVKEFLNKWQSKKEPEKLISC